MATALVIVDSPVGVWGVEGDDTGVTKVYMPHEQFWPTDGAAAKPVAQAARQMAEYFAKRRRTFDVRLAPVVATQFQRDVWAALSAIPYGEVRTYGEVAVATGRPFAHRAVGNANHANPWPVLTPCHRVVAAHGLGGFGGGEVVKRFLLELEGASIPR
jgi:methylated-DNA-[protein]-cysteine S-methyltransferase